MISDTSHNSTSLLRQALIVFVVAGVGCVIGGALDLTQMARAYLVGWFFWFELSLGCYSMLLLHNLTGGKWGFAVRPWAQAGAATLPLVAVLFIPIALDLEQFYEWADLKKVAADPILAYKAKWYLNTNLVFGFYTRAAVYFVFWILSWLLTRAMSRKLLRTDDVLLGRRLRLASGLSLAFSGLAVTFASVDWLMSLEPHWFSTIYGAMILMGAGLFALAFVIAVSIYFPSRGWDVPAPTINQMHDLGKLTLGFVMLWTYMSFMQFLIIWYGNLPEEIPWYVHRVENGGWGWIAGFVLLFHFFVPFFLLLSRSLKRNARSLLKLASYLVVVHWVEVWWLIQPALSESVYFPWRDLLATAMIGGLWMALFAWSAPQGEEARLATQTQKHRRPQAQEAV